MEVGVVVGSHEVTEITDAPQHLYNLFQEVPACTL